MKRLKTASRLKIIAIVFFAFALLFAFAACGGSVEIPESGNGTSETPDISPEVPDNTKNVTVRITVNGTNFTAVLADNETAKAFAELLPLTLGMSAMAHEKYYNLPVDLPADPYSPRTIEAGDLMLWNANCLVLFYETFPTSYAYTRIGKLRDAAGLSSALGAGSVTVSFSLSS